MKKVLKILMVGGGLIGVIGALAGIKGLQIGRMVAHGAAVVPPAETVTATPVRAYRWESTLRAAGSLQAVQGVMVTAEMPGRVTRIAFEPGTKVAAGSLLLQQDITVELADQQAAQSEMLLARKNHERAAELLPDKVISRSAYDDSKARYDQAVARLEVIRASIAKKSIKAPFTGRLGLRQVNLGQMLATGQPIVSLQSLDPIYVNFLVPQQELAHIREGQAVSVTTDAGDNHSIDGIVSAINAEVDSATRNVRIQATVSNPDEQLRPGMYATVVVKLPEEQAVLAIPATAVLYAPYSDSVFVIEENSGTSGTVNRVVRQQFVQLGDKQGDFIAVHSGLKPGDSVVSTGVFKLRNGQAVVVDNTIVPQFQWLPKPQDA